MRAMIPERGQSPAPSRVRRGALLALLALGCSAEASPSGYFDPRGEVFISPQFNAEECVVIEGALATWNEATQGDVAFRVRIGDGYPRILPARVGDRIRGEFIPSEEPQIILDTSKAGAAHLLRNLTLHELGHSLGLAHIAHVDSVMYPFATTVQELDPWTLAAWTESREAALSRNAR